MPTRNAEEYLEAIYVLSVETKNAYSAKIAQYLGFSPPSVTQAMRRLRRDGLVAADGPNKEIVLTPRGLEEAERVVRRHRLAERWAYDVLGLDWVEAHQQATHLEHALTPLIEERLWLSLGKPTTCPHGNPIPGLAPPVEPHVLRPLADARPGERAVVDRVFEQAEGLVDFLHYLESHGLVPGARLEVQDVATDYIRCRDAGGGDIEIPIEAARRLLVRIGSD